MHYGSMMVWNIQNMAPKMGDYDIKDVLPLTERVFNREELLKEPKHLLRAGEDKDTDGIEGNFVI